MTRVPMAHLWHTFSCVEATEVGCSVDDDALHRHIETEVETFKAIGFENLGDAVAQAGELSLCCTFADVGGKPGSGEVKGVDEAKGGGTGCTS